MVSLGDVLGQEQVDKNAIKYQFDSADIISFLQLGGDSISVGAGPLRIKEDTIGTSFIFGHPVNGVLGTTSPQIVLGSSGRVLSTIRVANPNDKFREVFRDNNFIDTGVTDAVVDTVNFRVRLA